MAKKKKAELTADEQVEQNTLEAHVAAEEAVDARVAEVFDVPGMESSTQTMTGKHVVIPDVNDDGPQVVIPPTPELKPVLEVVQGNAPTFAEPTATAVFLTEAQSVLKLLEQGDAVSPGEMRRLLNRAVALLS